MSKSKRGPSRFDGPGLFGDLSGLPSTLLMVGDAEVILDDSTRFAAKALARGSPVTIEVWPRMVHCWPIFADVLPEGRAAIDRITAYLGDRSRGAQRLS